MENIKKDDPRSAACSALLLWEKFPPHERRPLSEIAEDVLTSSYNCSTKDRALARNIIFGVVRWLLLIDHHIDSMLASSKKKLPPLVRMHLRIGVYQILFLERVPPRAAVNEAVKGVKKNGFTWAASLVNAILRRVARRRDRLGMEGARKCDNLEKASFVKRVAIEKSHPVWMVERLIDRHGRKMACEIMDMNNLQAPFTLRTNILKIDRMRFMDALSQMSLGCVPGRFSPQAVMIKDFKGSPSRICGFQQGWFQVQDEGAQLVSYLLGIRPGERVLDMCAGVGGKTTHLAELSKDEAHIDAMDVNRKRLDLLKENMKRLGIRSVNVVDPKLLKADGANEARYDRIMIDAPCSGLGVIRRHPDIKWNRSSSSFSSLKRDQLFLLKRASALVRPGGIIVYATCSLEPEETTEVIHEFLDESPGWMVLDARNFLPEKARSLVEAGLLRTYPMESGPDGFFGAVLSAPC